MHATSYPLDRDTPLYNPVLDASGRPDAINSLLRGELSAIESYDQVLEKYATNAAVQDLRAIRVEHFAAARLLREQVQTAGGEPTDSSGPWGVFAGLVTGTAKVLGLKPVVSALQQGEELGISDYTAALENDSIPVDCRNAIASELLPMCRKHVAVLTKLAAENSV